MAADWIKMRGNLWDHPKVVVLARQFGKKGAPFSRSKSEIVGALFRTWALADAHTEDGVLSGYDADTLDLEVGLTGWSEAIQRVDWLEITANSLIVPRFGEHNGASAKRRSEDARRKADVRNTPDKCPKSGGQNADQIRTEQNRTEQNREDQNTDPDPSEHLDVSFSETETVSTPSARGPAHVAVGTIAFLASDLFRKAGYSGRDGSIFWKAAALAKIDAIPETLLHDAANGCRATSPANVPAYFRKTVQASASELGWDFEALLKTVRVSPKCPGTSSWEDAR